MTVKFSFDHDIETVADTLFDPEFRVERCAALNENNAECEVDGDDDNVQLTMSREVTRELPSVLKKVFTPVQTLTSTEKWYRDGEGWKGSIEMKVKGQPVVITADYTITPTATGCEYVASHQCKAKIPLVGGKVEKFALSQTDDGAKDELEYLAKVLAG
jgi:hypothetical protein